MDTELTTAFDRHDESEKLRRLHVMLAVAKELEKATAKFGPMASPHEAYAIIKEELDEYWDECREKTVNHDKTAMFNELKQVAAMAIRGMLDVCDYE